MLNGFDGGLDFVDGVHELKERKNHSEIFARAKMLRAFAWD